MAPNTAKFGLATARDLFGKLEHDRDLLLRQRPENTEEQRLEEYEAFNFFVTAWHLHHDWLGNNAIEKPNHSLRKIADAHSHLKEVRHAIRGIANGSKHFSPREKLKVSVGPREISSYYSYFFGPQYAIDTKSFHFLMYELVVIVMEYFDWIFDDESPSSVPVALLEKLEKAKELRIARENHRNNSF
ncbi:hypothetical protein CR155_18545 [Pollutimonas nitritireducens]|uniref:Uncharacterized protein n=1 Tax=Pollutimonas nitritireducens TaxID=2045209 RepID=A0A2N4UB69_9BURK|nr:hypothetical protein [Pollutimonas nitritireducens]PLC52257.1 hypothetical protein CR155_18545 [Pollutimonas nitritireducens]